VPATKGFVDAATGAFTAWSPLRSRRAMSPGHPEFAARDHPACSFVGQHPFAIAGPKQSTPDHVAEQATVRSGDKQVRGCPLSTAVWKFVFGQELADGEDFCQAVGLASYSPQAHHGDLSFDRASEGGVG
jgi:hypothetical protein